MPQSKLFEEIRTYLRAGYPAVWINSLEPNEAAHELLEQLAAQQVHHVQFDIADGFRCSATVAELPVVRDNKKDDQYRFSREPTNLLRTLPQIKTELDIATGATPKLVIVIRNAHFEQLLGKSSMHTQLLQRLFDDAKLANFSFVVTGNFEACPAELKNAFVLVDHALPTAEELVARAKSIEFAAEDGVPPVTLSEDEWKDVAEAAGGLTASQAENAFALSYVRKGRLDPTEIWSVKAQALKKSGLLEICEGPESFANLGGVEGVKHYARTVLNRKHSNPHARPKSLLFLGVPGGGKSAFVKALGKETRRRVLRMDLGSMRGKYQGESENNVLSALRMADSMEPCILFLDEIEKAFAGSTSSDGDSGTSMRIFGSWLTWLNDHTTDVLVIGTANDASNFPPAFTRAERFDGTFFFDLPTAAEREAIWRIYWPVFFPESADALEGMLPNLLQLSHDWTGAEIKHCCRQACLRGAGIDEVVNLVPVYARKDKADLDRLRLYAEVNLCWSATEPNTVYRRKKPAVKLDLAAGRKVVRAENN